MATRDQATIDRLSALVANPFRGLLPGTGLNGSTTAAENLLRAFPQFSGNGGVRIEGDNTGSSYFHMMQVRLERRFSGGLQLLANYQWSKLIETDRRLISANPFLEKRIGNEDRPHRLVMSGSYELPFGPGKPFGAASGPVFGRIIGGWVLNGIFIVQPGAPLNWEDRNVIYYGGDLNLDPHRVNGSFDTTRFQTDSRAQLDRNIRTFPSRFSNLRQDGVKNVDLSVIKDTKITERVNLQYRFEAFNAFNRPTFNAPSLTPTDRNFGEITGQANLNRTVQMGLRLKW
jgi:hypothetical protein